VPPYRQLCRAALTTAAVSLLAFGLAHAAIITWVVDRSQDSSLLLRLGVMFGAPIMIGAIPATISALVGAAVWRANWQTPLATAKWGIVMASAILPALVLNLSIGPSGDAPAAWAMPLIFAGVVLVPAALGGWFARSRYGLLAGLAALPIGLMLSFFIQAEALGGWTAAFVASIFAILLASGWLMNKVATSATAISGTG
jgi:hypothetical protein